MRTKRESHDLAGVARHARVLVEDLSEPLSRLAAGAAGGERDVDLDDAASLASELAVRCRHLAWALGGHALPSCSPAPSSMVAGLDGIDVVGWFALRIDRRLHLVIRRLLTDGPRSRRAQCNAAHAAALAELLNARVVDLLTVPAA